MWRKNFKLWTHKFNWYDVNIAKHIWILNEIIEPWVNFINILCATFSRPDPKSAKRYWQLDWILAFLGSVCVKAARKTLIKLTPDHNDNPVILCCRGWHKDILNSTASVFIMTLREKKNSEMWREIILKVKPFIWCKRERKVYWLFFNRCEHRSEN